jgi:hypothetical protein
MLLTPEQEARFWANTKRDPATGCLLWTAGCNSAGYGLTAIGSYPKKRLAHRLAYALTKGDPTGFNVCHTCDTPPCVEPSDLFLGTQDDNLEDARAKGRMYTPPFKLTDEAKRAIRRRYRHGETQTSLAVEYGVSRTTIHNLVRKEDQ